MMRSVALVDDHTLLRQGLASLVNSFQGYKVVFEADNGKQFIEKMDPANAPEVVLLDINMPLMDGFQTATWLSQHHPSVKILALSMSDEEHVIIKMLESGAHGYILKNSTPDELQQALNAVITKGYYINDIVGTNLISSLSKSKKRGEDQFDIKVLNTRELEFIQLSCSELSYGEIAAKMNLSVKSMDFYKNNIEKKIGIKNRIALMKFALKNGIIKL
jgi:two-component system, NarL family, invasion response regulator UvrY